MEGLVNLRFSDLGSSVRKRRSNTSRRPRNDSQPHSDYYDISSLSSTPPSDNVSKVSSDDNASYGTNGKKKEHNLGKCSSRASSCNVSEDKGFEGSNEASNGGSLRGSNEQRRSRVDSRRSSEGVPSPANWKDINKVGQSRVDLDGLGNENKVKKVKLKVGGVIRTIHANSAPDDGASAVGSSSTKSSRFSDAAWPQQKLVSQDNSDDNHSFSSDKRRALRGVPWKDFSRSGFNARKMDSLRDRIPEENLSTKQTDKYEPVRKSKRVPKIRSLNNDGYDDDEEIQYLEKLKASKASAEYSVEYEDDEEGGRSKQRKLSKVLKKDVDGLYNMDGIYDPSRSGREGKKSRSGVASQDDDYVEEEEPVSDGEPDMKGKKPRKEFIDSLGDSKKEMTVTTRQRALQTGKDLSSCLGSLIEFPNGLPPAPPRKQKEKLSEVEQQLKKAEAAQRRRMQVEKAARESEAEAIRKILGQDSSRKKREDKIKKRQEELAQEKAANAMTLASETVRWVMGPLGTVVTFPEEMGLPSIFDSKPCRYPPPREKCAGPSCTNPYKYRDSKSKLPLCSLQCYKAIQEKILPMTAC